MDRSESTVQQIPAHLIHAGNNDRAEFDQAALEQLAASIAASGLAQPPTVRPMADGSYEIVAGERRCRAMGLLGWAEYPCIVRDLTDDQAADVMLLENVARQDLNVVEEARAYQSRIARGLTAKDVAERAGVSLARVQSRIRLLELADDVQHLVAHRQITLGQADALVGLDVNRQRLALAGLHEGLDDRGYRSLIARLRAEQDQEVMFDPDSFWSVEEYVLGAQTTAVAEQLSIWADQISKATRARDTTICQLHKSGKSLREIAALVGLSHAGVRSIVTRGA